LPYDVAGRLASVTDGLGSVTSYTEDTARFAKSRNRGFRLAVLPDRQLCILSPELPRDDQMTWVADRLLIPTVRFDHGKLLLSAFLQESGTPHESRR